MDILLVLSLSFSLLPLTNCISDISDIHILVEVGGEELENISFKSIVINRLLIGLEIFTIMPVN